MAGRWTGRIVNDPVAILRALPPTALYDVFAEAANQLIAMYLTLLRAAVAPRDQEQLREQIGAVRDLRYAVRPEEVDRQIELILAWQREHAQLSAPRA